MRYLIPLALVLATLHPALSFATYRQYRCNGLVQYRPCEPIDEQDSISAARVANRSSRLNKPALASTDLFFAKVLEQTYKPGKARLGTWSGKIRGNGDISLHLQLLRNGQVDETRYMGHVFLPNKSTTFRFKSSVPADNDWSWRVLASASSQRLYR